MVVVLLVVGVGVGVGVRVGGGAAAQGAGRRGPVVDGLLKDGGVPQLFLPVQPQVVVVGTSPPAVPVALRAAAARAGASSRARLRPAAAVRTHHRAILRAAHVPARHRRRSMLTYPAKRRAPPHGWRRPPRCNATPACAAPCAAQPS